MTAAPQTGADAPLATGDHLPDPLVDSLDRSIRRMRRVMLRPMAALVPVPALGRQLDVSKIFACDTVAELLATRESVSVKDVAAALQLEHSTVSRLLGEVEAEGLLARAQDPADRRRTIVTLTDLGQQVVAQATLTTRQFTKMLLADWPREDVEDLQRLLGKLADTVSEKLDLLHEQALCELRASLPDPQQP